MPRIRNDDKCGVTWVFTSNAICCPPHVPGGVVLEAALLVPKALLGLPPNQEKSLAREKYSARWPVS